MDIIFAGGKFRAKSKFANIAKISSTRKIGVIQYLRHSTCYGEVIGAYSRRVELTIEASSLLTVHSIILHILLMLL